MAMPGLGIAGRKSPEGTTEGSVVPSGLGSWDVRSRHCHAGLFSYGPSGTKPRKVLQQLGDARVHFVAEFFSWRPFWPGATVRLTRRLGPKAQDDHVRSF